MNLETALLAFGIASFTIGLTILTVYNSFGPGSKNLIDPFEEDDDYFLCYIETRYGNGKTPTSR